MKTLRSLYFSLFSKLALALALMSLLRILFYLFNHSYFGPLSPAILYGGLRYDLIVLAYVYMPFTIWHLVYFKGQSKFGRYLYNFSNLLVVGFNVIDFKYFQFTLRRTSSDLFTTSGMGNDVLKLLPQFLIDFWYLIALAIGLLILMNMLYKRSMKIIVPYVKFLPYILFLIPSLLVLTIFSRGGIQLRPLSILNASEYAGARDIPLVLNTPYTIIKSAYKEDLLPKTNFDAASLASIYTPAQKIEGDSQVPSLNVVLIILESFGQEYIGAYHTGMKTTPFLDSLASQSLLFENMFANGKKSIEALPAILSGLPTLMNTSYIASKYAGNRIESLPSKLKEKGYSTSFYHGGTNGTMGFDSFVKMAGIDRYYGLNEYPTKSDYDGNWGIFDEPYLNYYADQLGLEKEPFFSSVFTISSHHPFTIPEKLAHLFPKNQEDIFRSIQYVDYALKQFFKKASKQAWFDQTIFILTADHTSQNFDKKFASSVGIFKVPLLFYSPKYIQPEKRLDIAQQNDIFPSVLDKLGISDSLICFGNSLFSENKNRFAISFINNYYQLIEGDFCLQHTGESSLALYNYKNDVLLKKNLLKDKAEIAQNMERQLLGIIQQYNNRMINNSLSTQ